MIKTSRRRMPALALLAVLIVGPAQGQTVEKEFEIHAIIPFLELGKQTDAPAAKGTEMAAGPISWATSTEGRMAAGFWRDAMSATFRTAPGRTSPIDVSLDQNPTHMDAWRGRHGYMLRGSVYSWNGETEDEPMNPQGLGPAYDEVLTGSMKLWIGRRALAPNSAEQTSDDPSGELVKKISMRYDTNGLIGTVPVDFYIHLWGIPDRVSFEIAAHTPECGDDRVIGLTQPNVRHDDPKPAALEEWRRRHGYSFSSGRYAWDADFPAPRPDISAFGPQIDALFDRSAQVWTRVVIYRAMASIDLQLKNAIGWQGLAPDLNCASANADLRKLQDSPDWRR